MKVGIVGLPNVGKSTLFNALTKSYAAEAGNFPFCTIDPNVGRVNVADERLDTLKDLVKAEKIVHATVEFVDIAGLVRGASQGEGLGNKFLANIREVDAILQVVRHFEDTDVHHVDGNLDPIRDKEIINAELILADLDTLEKRIKDTAKKTKAGDKDAIKKLAVLEKVQATLEAGGLAITTDLSDDEKLQMKDTQLLTFKPFIYAVNVAEEEVNITEKELRDIVDVQDSHIQVLPICAKLELDMMDLDDADRKEFLADMGIEKNLTDEMIKACFHTLGLQYFFTAGVQEVRAWTIIKGSTAPQAAGRIHTDFEKKFIKAEVVTYDDFIEVGGWSGAKEKGKYRLEGKDYIVQEGDIILFKTGA